MRSMILGWVFHFFGIHYFFFFSPSPNSCVFCGENQQITGLWFLYKGKWCWQGLVLQIFRQLDDISYLNLSLEGGGFPCEFVWKNEGYCVESGVGCRCCFCVMWVWFGEEVYKLRISSLITHPQIWALLLQEWIQEGRGVGPLF